MYQSDILSRMKISELPKHHALLLSHSDRQRLTDEMWTELRGLSPAHVIFNSAVLDIFSARQITSWAKTSYEGERIALISFHTIGIPAQNALLKILEEPTLKTRFILLTSNTTNLLDTVLSRLQIHTIKESGGNVTMDSDLFLKTSPIERMKLGFVQKLLAKTDKEDRKDREAVYGFICSLVESLSTTSQQSIYIPETLEIASYASDPSASGKALLEYLALLLPQTKV